MAQLTWPQSLLDHGPVLGAAFAVTLLVTPVCRRIALKRNIVDRPDDWLKPHKRPIPYLGGVALFVGWTVALLLAAWFHGGILARDQAGESTLDVPMILAVIVAGTLVMGIGLFDDLHLTSPATRLVGTALVGVLLILYGVGDGSARALLTGWAIGTDPAPGWLVLVSAPLSLFLLLGACNATNMLDGLDGLCAGVLAISSAGFVALEWAVSGSLGQPPDSARLIIGLALAGAALGFLPYNRNPATIFMGDAGSMLLGMGSAVMLLLFADSGRPATALGALVVFGVPVGDMCLTLVRRRRNGRPLMKGDRSHYYDQLVDRGLPVRKVALISYLLAAAYAVCGCAIGLLSTPAAVICFVFVMLATAALAIGARMVRIEPQPPAVTDAPAH